MATTYEIIQGLHQAAANAHDGAHVQGYSSDNKSRSIGLKREEGDPIVDSRIIDGFKIKTSGNMLTVIYTSDIKLKDVYMKKDFEGDMEDTIEKIVSFLKKEYKDITKETISLTPVGEVSVFVQPVSRQRTTVEAKKHYKINSLKDVEPVSPPSQDLTRDITRKFLEMGREKAKKPTNASFKNESLNKKTLFENVENVVSVEGGDGIYTGKIMHNGKDVTKDAKYKVAKLHADKLGISVEDVFKDFDFSIKDFAEIYAQIINAKFESEQPEKSWYEEDSYKALKAMSKL